VLGTALILGGIKHRHQQFNSQVTDVSNVLLMLSSLCVLLPGILASSSTERNQGTSNITLSRVISILMLIVYICYIVFQLYTHTDMFQDAPEEEPKETDRLTGSADPATSPIRNNADETALSVEVSPVEPVQEHKEEEEEGAVLSMIGALVLMAAVSAVIAVVSEALVGMCIICCNIPGCPINRRRLICVSLQDPLRVPLKRPTSRICLCPAFYCLLLEMLQSTGAPSLLRGAIAWMSLSVSRLDLPPKSRSSSSHSWSLLRGAWTNRYP
jgi:hypothetical protein